MGKRVLVTNALLISAIWARSLPAFLFIQRIRHKIPDSSPSRLLAVYFLYFAATVFATIGSGVSRRAYK
jgi:hypothetical protein